MNLVREIISVSTMAVAPPHASIGQPASLGAVGSVAMLIRNPRWPGARLRRTALVSFVALVLLAPSAGWAQALQSFEDVALRVNLDDQLQVEDRSGAKATGRLTRLTRDEIAIQTEAGEKRFTRETVRAVAVRGHALGRGALIGAGVFAVLGAVATCSHEKGENCVIVGAFRAVPIGAGVGLAIGALTPRTRAVYREPENRAFLPRSGGVIGVQPSLLEDLALRVNLDDRLLGALIHKTTIIYPEPEKRISIVPAISRGAVGVTVSRRW
jgi:hypothetical protein